MLVQESGALLGGLSATMWKIRTAQMEVFQRAAWLRFQKECCDLVWESWGDLYAAWSQEAVGKEVARLLELGSGWGFVTRAELLRLVNVACMLGLGFQRSQKREWVSRILADSRWTAEEKIERILFEARQRNAGR